MARLPGILKRGPRDPNKPVNTVAFFDVVYQYQLPAEESHDAWLARFGLWKAAPYHDELWDGDLAQFRPKPLTKAELSKENKDLWVRKTFPVSIFLYNWAGKKKQRKDDKALQKINDAYQKIEALDIPTAKVIEEGKVAVEPISGLQLEEKRALKKRESKKRSSKSRKEEEIAREIDNMISDEPKKNVPFLNKDLVSRKQMLVEEFVKENGRNGTPEEVEKELQRRAGATALQKPLAGGVKGPTGVEKKMKGGEEEEEKEMDEEDMERRVVQLKANMPNRTSSGSGFGWELLDRLYGIFGQDQDIDEADRTDNERIVEQMEQMDSSAEALNRIDGLQGIEVQRVPLLEVLKDAFLNVYNSLFPQPEEEE